MNWANYYFCMQFHLVLICELLQHRTRSKSIFINWKYDNKREKRRWPKNNCNTATLKCNRPYK